jgi:hypothetical protein
MIEQAEATKLLEEFPEMQKFNNRLRLIAELKAIAAQELDPELIRDSYETILRMQERLYAEILSYISQEHEKLFKDLEAVYYEQKENIGMMADIIKILVDVDDEVAGPVKQKDKSHLKVVKNKSSFPLPDNP